MARIKELRLPDGIQSTLDRAGVTLRHFTSAEEFEEHLVKFLKTQNILHLGTCKDNVPRVTPLEYRLRDLTFYVLSEAGKKFINLKDNKNVSFSIAAPYHPEKDFFGNVGLQAWGTAEFYSRKSDPQRFEEALRKMGVYEALKLTGATALPEQFDYKVIEITPNEIQYRNFREGVYRVTWYRE